MHNGINVLKAATNKICRPNDAETPTRLNFPEKKKKENNRKSHKREETQGKAILQNTKTKVQPSKTEKTKTKVQPSKEEKIKELTKDSTAKKKKNQEIDRL